MNNVCTIFYTSSMSSVCGTWYNLHVYVCKYHINTKSWHPTSAKTCMWGRQLAAMLTLYTGKGVAPEVNLRECISCTPPQSANKAEPTLALTPREDITSHQSSFPYCDWPANGMGVFFKPDKKFRHLPKRPVKIKT